MKFSLMKFALRSFLIISIFLKSNCLFAQEIVGVNLVWGKKYLSTQKYQFVQPVKLDLYVKDFPFPDGHSFMLNAYSKSNGKLRVFYLRVNKTKKARRVESANLKCSDKFKIEVFHEEYEEKQFVFNSYDGFDPEDYNFILDVCCRPSRVQNLKMEQNNSFAIAFEVPSYKDDIEYNILPYFKSELNNFFYCKNKPFKIDFEAIDYEDAQGVKDELRYSFVRPIKGYNKGGTDASEVFKYHPNLKYIDWANGYSDKKPLGNGNSLSINEKTGMISGNCSKEGMYTIVVKVEQFRNGKSAGANLREYTFWIVDCPPETVAKPEIKINNAVEKKYLFCYNTKVDLEVENTLGFVYEWRRDGNIIQNATSNIVSTTLEGHYTVTAIDSRTCVNSQTSESVELKAKNRRPVVESYFGTVFGCSDKPVVLKLKSNEFNWDVEWQKLGNDGYIIKGQTASITQSGVYVARFAPSGCSNDSMSVFNGVIIGTKYSTDELVVKDIIVCPRTFNYYYPKADFGTKEFFQWFKNDELIYEGGDRMSITLPGKYTIYGGEAGCLSKLEELNVVWGENCPKDEDENLYLPDVVTINGDNINETLEIFNLEAFPDLELFLYNRQGHLIFYKSGMLSIYEDNTLWEVLKSMIGHQVAYRIKYNRGNLPEKIGKIIVAH